MIRILCYGDSNTWGCISGSDHQRYDEKTRWTKLLQKNLGKKYEVIEEGLNSRTLCSQDLRPGKEFTNGLPYFKPCLQTHDKFDVLILMLGTNELKFAYNNSPKYIFNMLLKYIDIIKNTPSQIDGSIPQIIISGMPPIDEKMSFEFWQDKYKDAKKKRDMTNKLYNDYCLKHNIVFVDNSDLKVGIDGVHITKESHSILANKLSEQILKL